MKNSIAENITNHTRFNVQSQQFLFRFLLEKISLAFYRLYISCAIKAFWGGPEILENPFDQIERNDYAPRLYALRSSSIVERFESCFLTDGAERERKYSIHSSSTIFMLELTRITAG